MGRFKTWGAVAVILALIAFAPAMTVWAQTEGEKPPQQDAPPKTETGKISGSLGVSYTNKGYHKATEWNPQKYTFNKGTSQDFTQEDFVKMLGGTSFSEGASLSFDKDTANKFLKGFCKGGETSGSMSGKVKSSSGGKTVIEVSGNVKCHWEEGGGKGQKDVEAKLSGSITFESGKGVTEVNITGDAKCSGTWNWGGGEMQLEGEAEVSAKNK